MELVALICEFIIIGVIFLFFKCKPRFEFEGKLVMIFSYWVKKESLHSFIDNGYGWNYVFSNNIYRKEGSPEYCDSNMYCTDIWLDLNIEC